VLSQAVVFESSDLPLQHQQIAVRPLEPGEVLVRVIATTLCGSDLHTLKGRRKVATPTILGHEILGKVVAFGEGHSRRDYFQEPLQVGDRVTWAIVAHCGQCCYCQWDLPQKCEKSVKYGHETTAVHGALTGGLAEYVILAPKTSIFRIQSHLQNAVACPANCATATVAGALQRTRSLRDWQARQNGEPPSQKRIAKLAQQKPLTGSHVIVLGGGMLGVTACAMSKWLGAEYVICVEPIESRRALVKQFGADQAVAPDQLQEAVRQVRSQGFDIALELSGATSAIEMALPALRIGGEIVLVGAVFPVPELKLLPEQMVRRMIQIQGLHNYAPDDLAVALQFLSEQPQEPLSRMVPLWFPLNETEVAIEQAEATKAPRVGILFAD
jgi:D-arabinose 1-dehydrogenase-like Zn-dependent alcohol dehydrogenase